MGTRYAITITRPTGTGGHDPISGQWLPGSVGEVWSGRADVIDDRLSLKQYADGDEAYDDADLLIFLREKVFHQVDVQDQVRWTVAGEERTGVVLGGIEVASALIVQLVSKEAQPLPSGLHIPSNPVLSAAVGAAYSYTITTADAEGPVTLTALSKPDWLTFTDLGNGTATLEGTPDQEDVGTVPITIQVSDGVALTAQAWVLTVQGGEPLYVASVEEPLEISPAMALGMKSAGLANDQTWGWDGITWVPYDLAGGMWDDIEDKPETATRWPTFSEVGGAFASGPRPVVPLTGTVNTVAESTTITGNGTLFTSEIVGGRIHIEGVTYKVTVLSDTELGVQFFTPVPEDTHTAVDAYTVSDAFKISDLDGFSVFRVNPTGSIVVGSIDESLAEQYRLAIEGTYTSVGSLNGFLMNDDMIEAKMRLDVEAPELILESPGDISFWSEDMPVASIDNGGNISFHNASSASITSNKELVLQQEGDEHGGSILRLLNRSGNNGAKFETTNPAVALVDFIFRTGNGLQRNIRFEARSGEGKAGVPSFHIGGANPAFPSLAVGDDRVLVAKKLGIGSYDDPAASLAVQAQAGQTDPLLDLIEEGGRSVFSVSEVGVFDHHYEDAGIDDIAVISTKRRTVPDTNVGVGFGFRENYMLEVDGGTESLAGFMQAYWDSVSTDFGSGVLEFGTARTNGGSTAENVVIRIKNGSTPSISLGSNNTLGSSASIAIGSNNSCSQNSALAIGTNNNVGAGGKAIGNRATAGASAIAIGSSYPYATGTESIAIGSWIRANATRSMVIGMNVDSDGHTQNNVADSLLFVFRGNELLHMTTTESLFKKPVAFQQEEGAADPLTVWRDSVGNPLVEILPSGDVELMDSSIGIIQRSPDGTRWRTGVDNSGNFTATAL